MRLTSDITDEYVVESASIVDIPLNIHQELRSPRSPPSWQNLSGYPKQSTKRGMLLFVLPLCVFQISLPCVLGYSAAMWTRFGTLDPALYLLTPLFYITIYWFRFIGHGHFYMLLPSNNMGRKTYTEREVYRRRLRNFLYMLFQEQSGVLVAVNNRLYKDRDKFALWGFMLLYKLETGRKPTIPGLYSSYRCLVAFTVQTFLAPLIFYGAVVGHELLVGHEKLKENFSMNKDAVSVFFKCLLGFTFCFLFVSWMFMIKMAFRYCKHCGFATRLRQLEKRIEEDIENVGSEEALHTWEETEKDVETAEEVRQAWTEEIWGKWKGDEQLELQWREYRSFEGSLHRYRGCENPV